MKEKEYKIRKGLKPYNAGRYYSKNQALAALILKAKCLKDSVNETNTKANETEASNG